MPDDPCHAGTTADDDPAALASEGAITHRAREDGMSEPRTIDAITHALPHPELRARFMREVNLTDVDQLPDTISRWQRFIERWEAGKPERDQVLAYIREHGHEPPHMRATDEAVADSDAFLERLQADTASRAGSSAA